jgi:hypothetical protein
LVFQKNANFVAKNWQKTTPEQATCPRRSAWVIECLVKNINRKPCYPWPQTRNRRLSEVDCNPNTRPDVNSFTLASNGYGSTRRKKYQRFCLVANGTFK